MRVARVTLNLFKIFGAEKNENKIKITTKLVKSKFKFKSIQDKNQCKKFEMSSSKMSKRSRNVQFMKFYEAFKKNLSDGIRKTFG